jgi:hypothetical protein
MTSASISSSDLVGCQYTSLVDGMAGFFLLGLGEDDLGAVHVRFDRSDRALDDQ